MKPTIIAIITLLFIASSIGAQTNDRTKYVGYEYDGVTPETTLPNGVKHLGGGLIGNIDAEPVYGISQVQMGKTKMLWFEASTGRDSSGVTGWKVIDVLSFPTVARSDYLFIAGDPSIECKSRGKDLPELVGIGRFMRRQGIFRPSKLWRADLDTKKFIPLAVAGVKCIYSEP
jgi:hypothetical protein